MTEWNEEELRSTLRKIDEDGAWYGEKLEGITDEDTLARKRLGELQKRGFIRTSPTNETPPGRTAEITKPGRDFISESK